MLIRDKKINIIDPSSTEFNRGSFCYAPYLLFNGLDDNNDVCLYETFIPENLDKIKGHLYADINIVTLWSYPQIECALMLSQFIPFETGIDNVYFAGYTSLIKKLGLRHVSEVFGFDPMSDRDFLVPALKLYPIKYHKFQRLLLSDCDMHLQNLEKGNKVHPLFTSYGCPNACSFCPSTKNCGHKRIELSIVMVSNMLDECIVRNIKYIHFTDEDFFFDISRAYTILQLMVGGGLHAIALGSADAVNDFIKAYGSDIFKESGLEVIEIGFESAAEDISHNMGAGKSINSCLELARIQHELPVRIFWLVLTFFPGETIRSLNITGQFMQKYGFKEEEVVGRLRTNGTKGGLGQYFQPYHGLGIYRKLEENGTFLTPRPVRLMPSYLPNSFLNSKIKKVCMKKLEAAKPWLVLYNIDSKALENVITKGVGFTVRDIIFTGNGGVSYEMHQATMLAVLARMEVIQ